MDILIHKIAKELSLPDTIYSFMNTMTTILGRIVYKKDNNDFLKPLWTYCRIKMTNFRTVSHHLNCLHPDPVPIQGGPGT